MAIDRQAARLRNPLLLTASIAAVLGLSAPVALATCPGNSTHVTSCADDGSAGTLRAVIACASSGDTIDMSGLTSASPGCADSRISLTTGALHIAQTDLNLLGPGAASLTITGYDYDAREFSNDRIVYHSGSGTLTIQDVRISAGRYTGTAASGTFYGGCIASTGRLSLLAAKIDNCILTPAGGAGASGGAIWSKKGVYLLRSVVTDSSIGGNGPHGETFGSGISTTGPVQVYSSTISDNRNADTGGALFANAAAASRIAYSTISGNYAGQGGGIYLTSGTSISLVNTTISGDSANGGSNSFVNSPATSVANSTIAFNNSENAAPGLFITGPSGFTFDMQSTIVSNNLGHGVAEDLLIDAGSASVTGADNLVYALASGGSSVPSGFGLPAGTCPLLGPLRDNGGPTYTHALSSGSPALAVGNNSNGLNFDQRESGYARTSSGAFGLVFTDIGAYEMQRADIVFSAGFDGCP